MFIQSISVFEALIACEAGVVLRARIPPTLAELDRDHVRQHLVVRAGLHGLLFQLDLLDLPNLLSIFFLFEGVIQLEFGFEHVSHPLELRRSIQLFSVSFEVG